MHSIIVGTAGHIDHGKTLLVHALTGVDADRLPEEKRRGITIDLGFADLDLGDFRIGFVDVPGHERFVKNMLAGAHGIDVILLVVAADEGIMPQTREHFEIARLLGVESGLIAITKTDMAEQELWPLVQAEIEELVSGSFLDGAPILFVSSKSGTGIDELRKALKEVTTKVQPRQPDTITRLPIDRAFTMRGFGPVVTGTLVSGTISEGDELELLPPGKRVRVRGLQVFNSAVKQAIAGQRTAVNLSGVETAELERGMVLAAAGCLGSTQVLDAQISLLKDAPKSLRSRSRVRVHLGTAEILARLQVLEESAEIKAGESGFVQVRLESPIVAVAGDRFIIRSYSPSRTIGGGRVLDVVSIRRRRKNLTEDRRHLMLLASRDRLDQIMAMVQSSAGRGVRKQELISRTGSRDEVLTGLLGRLLHRGLVNVADGLYVTAEVFKDISDHALLALEQFHIRQPLARGIRRDALHETAFSKASSEVFRSALSDLERKSKIKVDQDLVSQASYKPQLSVLEDQLLERIEDFYKLAGLEVPGISTAIDQARAAPLNSQRARELVRLLVDRGTLVKVTNDLYFHRDVISDLIEKLRQYARRQESQGFIQVPVFKELAGVSRKYAIPLLEYLDTIKITQRAGDRRLVL